MKSNIRLSVILCTHNPNRDYLLHTLEALEKQTLKRKSWELLLIDNASDKLLADLWNLSWHPLSRHIREDELGLTPARLRGISEAQGELLVFVDDDNLLHPSYLEVALQIAEERAYMGAFGGDIEGIFEAPISKWIGPYLESLAIRSVKVASWGCRPGTKAMEFTPCGAGMVIRKHIADAYRDMVMNDNIRRNLGRSGQNLISGEDSDMALCACRMGLAVGVFPQLKMQHIIPGNRLSLEYTLRLAEDITSSYYLLCYLWENTVPQKPSTKIFTAENVVRILKKIKRMGREGQCEKVIELVRKARLKGATNAYELIKNINQKNK